MVKYIVGIALFFFFTLTLSAQETVTGKVTCFNKYPLKGVKVTAKKSKQSVQTDSLGNYSIQCKAKDRLKIEMEGFQLMQIRTEGEQHNLCNLIFMNNASSQFKVVDRGLLTQDELDYALENLLGENNDYSRFQNMCDLLQSKFPLVKCIEDNGYNRIFIGSNPQSLNSGAWALLVVDGITTSEINAISPMQVADIRMLTGNDAASYGIRGSNGVIEIDLKASK